MLPGSPWAPRGCLSFALPLLVLAACGPRAPDDPRAKAVVDSPGAAAPDKARLFGDPTLVPTREGERARLELAAAGEIAAAIVATDRLRGIHVDVEFEADGAHVVVAGRRAQPGDDAEPAIAAIAQAVLAAHAPVHLTFAIAEPSSTPAPDATDTAPPRGRTAALAVAAMGLGASLAVFLDRLWWRRRRTARRTRART